MRKRKSGNTPQRRLRKLRQELKNKLNLLRISRERKEFWHNEELVKQLIEKQRTHYSGREASHSERIAEIETTIAELEVQISGPQKKAA